MCAFPKPEPQLYTTVLHHFFSSFPTLRSFLPSLSYHYFLGIIPFQYIHFSTLLFFLILLYGCTKFCLTISLLMCPFWLFANVCWFSVTMSTFVQAPYQICDCISIHGIHLWKWSCWWDCGNYAIVKKPSMVVECIWPSRSAAWERLFASPCQPRVLPHSLIFANTSGKHHFSV